MKDERMYRLMRSLIFIVKELGKTMKKYPGLKFHG